MRILNIEDALADLPYPALQSWFEYYQVEPWGWEVEELRQGQLCATIANWAGKAAKDPLRPSDFYIGPESENGRRQPAGPASLDEIEQKMGLTS